MGAKSLEEEGWEMMEQRSYGNTPLEPFPLWARALCLVLERRLFVRETEDAKKSQSRPPLQAGDVIRLAGFSHAHLIKAPAPSHANDAGNWLACRLHEASPTAPIFGEVVIHAAHVVEVYRGGKCLWRLPKGDHA